VPTTYQGAKKLHLLILSVSCKDIIDCVPVILDGCMTYMNKLQVGYILSYIMMRFVLKHNFIAYQSLEHILVQLRIQSNLLF